jgi:hypothetical protein
MFLLIWKRLPNRAWRRVDIVGAFTLLAASVFVVFVLEEAGIRYAWNSATIIAGLTLGCLCWVSSAGFPFRYGKPRRPNKVRTGTHFPYAPIQRSHDHGHDALRLLLGFPFMDVIVNLPQRFQAANAVSSSSPLSTCSLSFSAHLSPAPQAATSSSSGNLPLRLLVAGAMLQRVGDSLLGSLPHTSLKLQRQQFAYEAIMVVGLGLGLSTLPMTTPLVVSDQDMPVTMGALTRIRVMGGTLGLAIYSTIFNNDVDSRLGSIVSVKGLQWISYSASNIGSLSLSQQNAVRVALADDYTLQLHIRAGFSGLAFLVSFLI